MISYYKKSLIDVFSRLKEIKQSPAESLKKSFELQRILVNRIISVEKRIRKNKLFIEILIGNLIKCSIKEEQIQQSRDIRILKEVNKEYKRIIGIFKTVGDGLAFIYLYKWDVKPLIFKESCGFISGKKGLSKELSILKALYQKNKVAILTS